jgi:hypothetical protein
MKTQKTTQPTMSGKLKATLSRTKKESISRVFLTAQLTRSSRDNFAPAVIIDILKNIITRAKWLNKSSWERYALKLFNWLHEPIKTAINTPFTMFTAGNAKLPFLSWSTLPGFNCPGALDCWALAKGWCYSLKAWRYAPPFMRQLQNTIIERQPAYRALIKLELKRLLNSKKYSGAAVPFRLYVDGDFQNVQQLKFWMDTLKEFPRLRAYGYSKSLHLFKELDQTGYSWPANYALNLSSGGKYQAGSVAEYVQKMNITRGAFIAVRTSKSTLKAWQAQKLTKDQAAEIRANFSGSAFICPGKCGTCTSIKKNPHACGNKEVFKNKDILIPVH